MRYFAPNLPAAPTNADALEWGWIDPHGKAIKCVKPKEVKYYSHHDTTGRNGLPHWTTIFAEGYIRYAIGENGDALFCYKPEERTIRRLVKFIESRFSDVCAEGDAVVSGRIHIDQGGEKAFDEIELVDTPIQAIVFITENLK